LKEPNNLSLESWTVATMQSRGHTSSYWQQAQDITTLMDYGNSSIPILNVSESNFRSC